MTEEEACAWLEARYATRLPLLERFVTMLSQAATEQSLIAASTVSEVWSRHIVDSAQLATLYGEDAAWLDIGSGGGLPGMVVAIVRDAPMVLVEPRRKRAEFLQTVANELKLTNVTVECGKAQNAKLAAMVISARAVAPVDDVFRWTMPIVSRETVYLLPRGRSWSDELAITRRAWHGSFHVEQSITDPNSGIIVASGVAPR